METISPAGPQSTEGGEVKDRIKTKVLISKLRAMTRKERVEFIRSFKRYGR